MRGSFVLTSVLGTPPSPPPPGIGSIEPDTRGKTTIREILAAHRNSDTCNKCHRDIDPPGFALESFDPIGGFRTRYRANAGAGSATTFGFMNGRSYKDGPPGDASGVTADGRKFSGVIEFKRLLLDQKEPVARNSFQVPLVVQTDSSRVISVMIQDHFVVPKVDGVTGNHHNLSHHGQDQTKIEQLRRIESQFVKCFDSLLRQMKSTPESGSTLLDNTSILFGSNLGNANAHHARNLPILLAGGGFKHGQFITHDEVNNKPLCKLFVTMLNNAGVEAESFGQSTSALSWSASRHASMYAKDDYRSGLDRVGSDE